MLPIDGAGPLSPPQPITNKSHEGEKKDLAGAAAAAAVNAAALPALAEGLKKADDAAGPETCGTRVKKFFATIAYPFTWLFQKIAAIFRSIAQFCRELNGDTPRLRAPVKPQPKTIDEMQRLNSGLVEQFTNISTRKENVTKALSDLFSKPNRFTGVEDLKQLHVCTTLVTRFNDEFKAFGNKFSAHQTLRGAFKTDEKNAGKLAGLSETDTMLTQLNDNLKKEFSEIIAQWEKALIDNKDVICTLFKQFQTKYSEPVKIAKPKSAPSMAEYDEKAAAASPVTPKKTPLGPKESLELSKQYTEIFNLLLHFKWVTADEAHKKTLALLASGFSATVGLPNFEKGLNNVCWMNSSIQALRLVAPLITQLKFRVEAIQQKRKEIKGKPITEIDKKLTAEELRNEDLIIAFNKLLIARDSGDKEALVQSQRELVGVIRQIQGLGPISGFNANGPGVHQGDAHEWIVRSFLEALGFSMNAIETANAEGETGVSPIGMEAFRIIMPINPPADGLEALGKPKGLPPAKSNVRLNFLELLESQVRKDTDDPNNKWRSYAKYSKTTQLTEAPPVLVTQLNRFSFEGGPSQAQKKEMIEGLTKLMKQVTKDEKAVIPNRKAENVIAELLGAPKKAKINTPVDMQEVTDFSNSMVFTDEVRKAATANRQKIEYRLNSCIIHESRSTESGHFVAIGRDDSGQWRLYNDDKTVKEISVKEALELASMSYIQFSEKVSG